MSCKTDQPQAALQQVHAIGASFARMARSDDALAAAPGGRASTGNRCQLIVTPSGRTRLVLFASERRRPGRAFRGAGADQHDVQGHGGNQRSFPAQISTGARPASWSRIAMPAPAPTRILSLIYEPAVALFGQASLIMRYLRTKGREEVGCGYTNRTAGGQRG